MARTPLIKSVFTILLDFLFPRKASIRRLENMSLPALASLKDTNAQNEEWIKSFFSYKNNHIRELIWQIKYKGNRKLSEKIAEIMTEEIQNDLSELLVFEGNRKPILIPIPLSRTRLRERGFNQTELVAREIADRIKNLDYRTDILIRNIHKAPQTHTRSRSERLLNIVGSFKVTQPATVYGKTIFLLDDVTTTGATLSEARKVLLKAGAKDVKGYTIAH